MADRATKEQVNSDNARLKSQLSTVLRDQLLGELKEVNSVDAAAIWARRILPAKNSLNIVDAAQLENAFQAKLAALESGVDSEPQPPLFGSAHNPAKSLQRKGSVSTRPSTNERVKTNILTYSEPRRVRDREHVKFVAGHPCLICGRRPADPHHLRFAQSRALGRKVSDESHCAVVITGKFISVATKQHGGQRSPLIRSGWQTPCGARHIRQRDAAFALEPPLVRTCVLTASARRPSKGKRCSPLPASSPRQTAAA